MPTATLKSYTVGKNGKPKEVATSVSITHNNARLYYHTDGETYYFVGLDASGNRIYQNAKKARG